MRLRNASWVLVMLAAPAFVLAQETQQSQPPAKPPEKPAAEEQKAPEPPQRPLTAAEKLRAQFPPAPKPGHPLDPADVDVLTGKTRSTNPYGVYGSRIAVDPYSGFGYQLGAPRFNPSIFASPDGSMLSGFTFGDTGGHRFSLLNNSRPGMPILLFNHGTNRGFVFLGRGLSFF